MYIPSIPSGFSKWPDEPSWAPMHKCGAHLTPHPTQPQPMFKIMITWSNNDERLHLFPDLALCCQHCQWQLNRIKEGACHNGGFCIELECKGQKQMTPSTNLPDLWMQGWRNLARRWAQKGLFCLEFYTVAVLAWIWNRGRGPGRLRIYNVSNITFEFAIFLWVWIILKKSYDFL